MSVGHQVTGYDKRTEELAHAFDVPSDRMTEVRELALVDTNDVDAIGSYPLTDGAARSVADKLKLPMSIVRCDWFLEPVRVD